MNFKRIPSGEYYYFRKEGNTEFTIMAVADNNKRQGVLHLASSSPKVPRELIGKRVRVKLEVVK